MSTEVFEYHLQVRDDATGPVAKVSAAAAAAGGPTSSMAAGIASINEGAKNMASRLGPAAAAISSVSASLGAAGGSAGKFVAMGGQIAAAFGAGGPVGAAIVAGTVAVDAFSSSLLKVEAAREAAFEKNFDRQYGNILRMSKATQEINDRIRAIDVDIMYAGVEGDDRAALIKQEEVFRLRDEANSLRNQAGDARKEMLWSERERLRGDAKAAEVRADRLEEEVDKLVKYKVRLDEIAEARGKAFGGRSTTDPLLEPITGDTPFDEYSFANTDVDVEQEKEDAKERIREETARREADREEARAAARTKEAKKLAGQLVDIERHAQEMKLAIQKDIDEQRTKARELAAQQEKEFWQGYSDLGQSAFLTLTSTATDYFEAKAKGEAYAEEKAISSFLRTTGEQIIALGTKQMFEGGGMTLVGDPRGPALLGLGAVAVATGAAMSGGGAAWSGNISKMEAADAERDKARTEKGPTSGSLGSGGTRTEAGVTYQVIYGGLSGPTADQGLRTFTKAQGMAAGRAGLVSRRQRYR